jgi:hypothetical protein
VDLTSSFIHKIRKNVETSFSLLLKYQVQRGSVRQTTAEQYSHTSALLLSRRNRNMVAASTGNTRENLRVATKA